MLNLAFQLVEIVGAHNCDVWCFLPSVNSELVFADALRVACSVIPLAAS